ncbi:hypothetical protein SCUCBS95973_009984, partial [Sporothrix curviconia]
MADDDNQNNERALVPYDPNQNQNNGDDVAVVPYTGQHHLPPPLVADIVVPNHDQLQVLRVGGRQLATWCHNAVQNNLLDRPGQDVIIVRGKITPDQIRTHRPSYINALLTASRGRVQGIRPCSECVRKAKQSVYGLPSPFIACIRVADAFPDDGYDGNDGRRPGNRGNLGSSANPILLDAPPGGSAADAI